MSAAIVKRSRIGLLIALMTAPGFAQEFDELDYQMSPESIERALAFVGSVRPMDELRANLRARLEREKARTSTQLELLATARAKLEAAIRDAEAECDRLRQQLRLPRVSDDSP